MPFVNESYLLLAVESFPSSRNIRRLLFISSVRGANNFAVLDWDRAFNVANGVNTDAVTDCARDGIGNFDGAISATDEKTDAVTDLGLCSLIIGGDGSNSLDVTALKLLTAAGGVQFRLFADGLSSFFSIISLSLSFNSLFNSIGFLDF